VWVCLRRERERETWGVFHSTNGMVKGEPIPEDPADAAARAAIAEAEAEAARAAEADLHARQQKQQQMLERQLSHSSLRKFVQPQATNSQRRKRGGGGSTVDDTPLRFKVCLLGLSTSALVRRRIFNEFSEGYDPTIEYVFLSLSIICLLFVSHLSGRFFWALCMSFFADFLPAQSFFRVMLRAL
jgi:hypothetical protein